jgi:predicted nucleotidyltransferase
MIHGSVSLIDGHMDYYGESEKIYKRLEDHLTESLEYFNENNIVCLCLQGSQNYGLDLPSSDLDTKLIVTPSFKDIALAKKPVSTTHIRENNEHIDFKDIRLYMETFRKQNLNFLEILFTEYYYINPLYQEQWMRLMRNRERIAHMNEFRAVKSMKGIALEKYYAMEHPYPSKVDIIAEYGYDPKQLHHLVRVRDYLERYIKGESYYSCLHPEDKMKEYLLDIKKGKYDLAAAREIGEREFVRVGELANEFCGCHLDEEDEWARQLLEDVSYEIMKISVQEELKNG